VGTIGWTAAAQKEQQRARAGGNSALGNYLNDMKRAGKSRRHAVGSPTDDYQRMNERLSKLPAQISAERTRSCHATAQRRTASVESEHTESPCYGFTRKGLVCSARRSVPDILAHEEHRSLSTPATPRSARLEKADRRFQEIVEHMKTSSSWQKEAFETLKVKGQFTQGLLYSESVVKHAI